MRIPLLMVAVVCVVPVTAEADPARAKAANTRGHALHKQKKYQEAGAQYRKAIAEDPSHLLAHYNLACIGSLTKDRETAVRELAWVIDRATWDPAALTAAAKARTDRDLQWVRDLDVEGFRLTGTDIPDEGAVDLMGRPEPALVGKATTDTRLAKAIASAPGKHEERCSTAAFSAPFDTKATATVVATLRDGVALIDARGKVLARSEPLGCTSPQDQVTILNQVAGIASPYDYSDHALLNTRMVVVQYAAGSTQAVAIFAVKDKAQIVRVFDGVLKSEAGEGSLIQTPVLGHLLHAAPGEAGKRVFRWDAPRGKYVEDK
jgi:tetratricopeptide (TPR) repeat protein